LCAADAAQYSPPKIYNYINIRPMNVLFFVVMFEQLVTCNGSCHLQGEHII